MSQLATSYFLGPHQRDMCSQDVWASKTRSRGASNSRVMRISFSDGVVTFSSVLAAMTLLPSFHLFQVLVQTVVALLPELSVSFRPLGDVLDGLGPEPAGP